MYSHQENPSSPWSQLSQVFHYDLMVFGLFAFAGAGTFSGIMSRVVAHVTIVVSSLEPINLHWIDLLGLGVWPPWGCHILSSCSSLPIKLIQLDCSFLVSHVGVGCKST